MKSKKSKSLRLIQVLLGKIKRLSVSVLLIVFLAFQIVAQDAAANQLPLTLYNDFANNLQPPEGRGWRLGPVGEQSGSFGSSEVFWILVAIRILILYTTADPQYALLLDSFDYNGQNIIDELNAEALLPENQLLSRAIPNLLGGSTFTATSAFSGHVLDAEGTVLNDLPVGFGVFTSSDGNQYFSPIIFASNSNDLLRGSRLVLNLAPVVPESATGTWHATGRDLVARTVPEPATLALLSIGLASLGFIRRRLS